MKKINYILVLSLGVLIIACSALSSKEIDRVVISKISNIDNPDWKVTSLDLKKGDKLWFWTDMDIEYQGDLSLEYRIQLIKNTDTLGYIRFYPFKKKVTIGEIKTTFSGYTKWSFTGQMDFLEIKEDAKYTFRILLASSPNESLKLNHAILILKK